MIRPKGGQRTSFFLFGFITIDTICSRNLPPQAWPLINPMNILLLLTLINFVLLVIVFAFFRATKLSYTEIMVARKLGAYTLTVLAFIVVVLLILKKMYAVTMIAYGLNGILLLVLIMFFFQKLLRKR